MNAAKVLDDLKRRFPNEPEYHQAVEEVLSRPLQRRYPFPRICEPFYLEVPCL